MAVSADWEAMFAQMRAWAAEPGALLFPVKTDDGVVLIFPEDVWIEDDELLTLIEGRARGKSR